MTDELYRLRHALMVCEFVAHRAEPTDEQIHALQQASGAYWSTWEPEQIFDDLPEFEYLDYNANAQSGGEEAS